MACVPHFVGTKHHELKSKQERWPHLLDESNLHGLRFAGWPKLQLRGVLRNGRSSLDL